MIARGPTRSRRARRSMPARQACSLSPPTTRTRWTTPARRGDVLAPKHRGHRAARRPECPLRLRQLAHGDEQAPVVYQSCTEHESCANGSPGPAESTLPSYMVDASPVRTASSSGSPTSTAWRASSTYGTDYCWTATDCGDAGSGQTTDPWKSVYAFGGNGDGTLQYPGTPTKIGGTTPIAVPSIRLKLIRDGMEDFEYLHALDAVGDGAFATSTARAFITDAIHLRQRPRRRCRVLAGARRSPASPRPSLALHAPHRWR